MITNLRISDIADYIDESSNDLGTLSRSNHINKWSFRKPVNHSSLVALNDIQLYSINDGFNLIYHDNVSDMLSNINNDWSYSERNAPFRMSDFYNYDKDATEWFQLTFVNNSFGRVGETLRINLATSFIDIYAFTRFAVFNGVRSYADFGFIFSTNFSNSTIYFYKVDSLVNYDFNNTLNFRIPNVCSAGSIYQIRPVFTNAGGVMENGSTLDVDELSGNWYSFPPNCYGQFSVSSSGGGGGGSQIDLMRYIDITINYLNYTYDDGYLTLSNISGVVYAVIGESFHGDLNVSYTLYYYYDNYSYVTLSSNSFILNEDDYPWKNNPFTYNDTIQLETELKDPDVLEFRLLLQLSKDGVSQTETLNLLITKLK